MSSMIIYAITFVVALVFGILLSMSMFVGKLDEKIATGLFGFVAVVSLVISVARSQLGYNKPVATTIGDGYVTRVVKERNALNDGLLEITWTDNSGKEHKIEAVPEQDEIPEIGTLTVSTSTPNEFGRAFGSKTKSTVRHEPLNDRQLEQRRKHAD